LLDEVLTGHPEFHRASSGHSTYTFTPQPEKTFNRGYTDYFANDRQDDIGAFDAAGFVGEAIGEVTEIGPNYFMVNAESDFNNGDGVCFYDAHAEVVGFRINRAEGKKLFPVAIPEGLTEGATLFRNHDQAFERALEKESAERLVSIQPLFAETADGFALTLTDEDGISATVNLKNNENSRQGNRQERRAGHRHADRTTRQIRQHHVRGTTRRIAALASLVPAHRRDQRPAS
jgi:hypothetical protein